ncbi:MAG: DUF2059 domain-containing protein [Methylovirgula sp.]
MFSSFERHWTLGRAAVHFAAVASLLILAPFAQAQTPPSAATVAPPAAAEPSPSHLAAARELVVVSGMSRSFNAAIPQMLSQFSTTFTQTRPELAPDLAAVLKQIEPEFAKDVDDMVDKAAHIYARLLTEQEIKTAVAFFTSPGGKKYVETQPYFFNDVVNAMQDWHQKISSEMVTRVRAELKKKGHTL